MAKARREEADGHMQCNDEWEEQAENPPPA